MVAEHQAAVAVVVDEVAVKPSVEIALEMNNVTVLHAQNGRQAMTLVRALGVRCLVVIGRVWSLRARLELLVQLADEHPDCKSRAPVVVTDALKNEVPETAPCLIAKTNTDDTHELHGFFRGLLHSLGWRKR